MTKGERWKFPLNFFIFFCFPLKMDTSNTITEKECSKLVDQVLKEDNIIPSKEPTNQEKQENGNIDMIQESDEANLDKPELDKETIDRDKVIKGESDDDDKSNEDKIAEAEEDVDMDEERKKQIELDGLLSKALAEEEEEEEEEEEAEYEIEKIVRHKIFKVMMNKRIMSRELTLDSI